MTKLAEYGLKALPEYQNIDVVQVRSGRGHRYRVTGYESTLPTVTSYLAVTPKPWMGPWARKQAASRFRERMAAVESQNQPGEDEYDDYLDEVFNWAKQEDTSALEYGSATHNLIENLLSGSKHEVDTKTRNIVQPAVDGAMQAIRMKRFSVVGLEVPIWHPDYHYAGTIDFLGKNERGELVVMDWKRSSAFRVEYAHQVAAYSECLRVLMGLDEFPDCFVCKVPQAEGQDVEVKEVNVRASLDVFLKALRYKNALDTAGVWV